MGEPVPGPDRGSVSVVRKVIRQGKQDRRVIFLVLARREGGLFTSTGFRKLTPRADTAEAATPAFADRLRALPAAGQRSLP